MKGAGDGRISQKDARTKGLGLLGRIGHWGFIWGLGSGLLVRFWGLGFRAYRPWGLGV